MGVMPADYIEASYLRGQRRPLRQRRVHIIAPMNWSPHGTPRRTISRETMAEAHGAQRRAIA